MVSNKLTWQALKRNDLAGQADPHRLTQTMKTLCREMALIHFYKATKRKLGLFYFRN